MRLRQTVLLCGALVWLAAHARPALAEEPDASRGPVHALVDIAHEFTFYFDGRFGRAYVEPVGGRDARNWGTLATADLSDVNLLVLSHGSSPCPYTDADIALVRRFVEGGGGLLLVGDFARPGGGEFRLNRMAETFGIRFEAEKPSGSLAWKDAVLRHVFGGEPSEVPAIEGAPRGVLDPDRSAGWSTLLADGDGRAVVAVRESGKGSVAAIGGSGLLGEQPEKGDPPNALVVRGLVRWLADGKRVRPSRPPRGRMPEKETVIQGLRVQYSEYLQEHAKAIADIYFQVAKELQEILGVPLGEGKNLNLILIATGSGGFSSGVALGIGAFWGGFPEKRYGITEMIGHEATHSWVLPYSEPLWNEGLATYLGIEVARRLGYEKDATEARREWTKSCERLDPDYRKVDISKPEDRRLHAVTMGKPMWIWDRLREKYGDDILARYFQEKRRVTEDKSRRSYTAEDSIEVLSTAAGEDLFGWFRGLGIDVKRAAAER